MKYFANTVAVAAALSTALVFTQNGLAQAPFSFAAIGDVPYKPVSDDRQVYPVPQY